MKVISAIFGSLLVLALIAFAGEQLYKIIQDIKDKKAAKRSRQDKTTVLNGDNSSYDTNNKKEV